MLDKNWGNLKFGTGTVKNARVENAGVENVVSECMLACVYQELSSL